MYKLPVNLYFLVSRAAVTAGEKEPERSGEPKAAVMLTEAAMSVIVQVVFVPEQPPPLQPSKVEPEDGLAVSVMVVPSLNSFEHLVPQLILEGELFMVPLPFPVPATVSVYCLIPSCVTVKVWPAIVSVPTLWLVDLFLNIEYWIVPLSLPDLPDCIFSHRTLLLAVQLQLADDVVIPIMPIPPLT